MSLDDQRYPMAVGGQMGWWYPEEDVKESIRELKEEIDGLGSFSLRNIKDVLPTIIKKVFGEKLT